MLSVSLKTLFVLACTNFACLFVSQIANGFTSSLTVFPSIQICIFAGAQGLLLGAANLTHHGSP